MKKEGAEWRVLRALDNLGLVFILPKNPERSHVKFYVAKLMQQFLVSQVGSAMGPSKVIDQSLIETNRQSSTEKFLIVETNFKVYAYTSSKLHLAILKLFLRVECAFPNFIVATLVRSNLQAAIQRGISSRQIVEFLESHTHVTARQSKLAMQQSLMQNMSSTAYFDYTSAGRGATQTSLADLIGLSTGTRQSAVPANVKQQIELWEKELNCVKTTPAVMVVLNTKKTADAFRAFSSDRHIKILQQNMAMPGQKHVFVIESKHEKDAREF